MIDYILVDRLDGHKLDDVWRSPSSRNPTMRIDDAILKCVVFIGRPGADETEIAGWVGTGFLVDVFGETREFCHTYLVTAAHVASLIEGQDAVLKINLKDGNVAHFMLRRNLRNWWRHPVTPDAVDIAVIPWRPPLEADYKVLDADEWFLTDDIIKTRQIGPGDEIFITGLFSKAFKPGSQDRNIPIVRTGNIAMMPDRKILVKGPHGNVDANVYLIEARSIGGISGSPVFVRETLYINIEEDESKRPNRLYGRGQHYLLGIVHGHWSIYPDEKDNPNIRPLPKSHPESVNLGIAVVYPAKTILEVINHPELIQMRRDAEAKTIGQGTTEEDVPPC